MSNYFSDIPCLVDLPQRHDARGSLGFIETEKLVHFETKRVYYLYNIKHGETRGHHAHKSLEQLIFCPHGSMTIELKGKEKSFSFTLQEPQIGLYIPHGFWRVLSDFSIDAVCAVLCSDFYDEDDYIRDYQAFLDWEKER